MLAFKRWDKEIEDRGTIEIGDLGTYHVQVCKCARYDGKTVRILHIGKTLRECLKFREEFIRDGCFCWTGKELCFNVPICPVHPHGICGMDLEMRRTKIEIEGDGMLVFSTRQHWGQEELIAKIFPSHLVEYFGYLASYSQVQVASVSGT